MAQPKLPNESIRLGAYEASQIKIKCLDILNTKELMDIYCLKHEIVKQN